MGNSGNSGDSIHILVSFFQETGTLFPKFPKFPKKNNITRENFHEYRDSLIETCRKYLTGKLEAKDKIIDESIAIIRNQYRLNSTLI